MGKILTKKASSKVLSIKDLENLIKNLERANNFVFANNDFKLVKDKKMNKQLKNHIGMAKAMAEILKDRIKQFE